MTTKLQWLWLRKQSETLKP